MQQNKHFKVFSNVLIVLKDSTEFYCVHGASINYSLCFTTLFLVIINVAYVMDDLI